MAGTEALRRHGIHLAGEENLPQMTGCALAALRFYQKPTWQNGLLVGVITGLAVLTKPMPLLYPLLLALLFLRKRRLEKTAYPVLPLAACLGAMVVVSHEMGFARAAAHRVILMADGEIVEQGSPEEVFEHPLHERTKSFLSHIL